MRLAGYALLLVLSACGVDFYELDEGLTLGVSVLSVERDSLLAEVAVGSSRSGRFVDVRVNGSALTASSSPLGTGFVFADEFVVDSPSPTVTVSVVRILTTDTLTIQVPLLKREGTAGCRAGGRVLLPAGISDGLVDPHGLRWRIDFRQSDGGRIGRFEFDGRLPEEVSIRGDSIPSLASSIDLTVFAEARYSVGDIPVPLQLISTVNFDFVERCAP